MKNFELSISGRDDGTVEAVYIRFEKGTVARTEEVIEDTLMADYDAKGNLIGLEWLAPVKISDMAKLVEEDRRDPFRRFVKKSAPQDFLVGAS